MNISQTINQSPAERKMQATAELIARSGHPLETLDRENRELKKIIGECRKFMASGEDGNTTGGGNCNADTNIGAKEDRTTGGDAAKLPAKLEQLKQVSIHYAKKGDLLYPILKVRYQISGPSDLLWTEDDDILDQLKEVIRDVTADVKNQMQAAASAPELSQKNLDRLEVVFKRLELMIVKENRVTFPNCAMNFTEGEWMGIYRDSKDYDICFGVESNIWEAAENYRDRKEASADMEVVMPGGHMSPVQLAALLNTIPMEITFIDDNNINRFFNEGPKIFKRPVMALDREMFSCHPPKFEAMARRIVDEFRAGTLDEVPIWSEYKGRTILTTYRAVRDKDGSYLGTVELVQDMEKAKEYFVKKPVEPAEED